MVNWFKHDIPAWMDGTEALSDGAYRAYHVICQLIYLHEGSIALNEHGLAGRCRQSVRAFRRNLAELIDAKKLTLDNGRLRNSRADIELEKIGENRINAAKGGEKSGESRNVKAKSLKNNEVVEAPLPDTRSLKEKTRLDESRADQDSRAGMLCRAIVNAFERANSPNIPDTSRVSLWLSQGYEPSIILAAVSTCIARKPSINTLNYFDNAIREAHEMRAPKPPAPAVINWDTTVAAFKATGNWPRSAPGSEPGMAGCQVPAEILRKHGLDPAGATLAPAAERPAKNPHEQLAQVVPAKAAPAENAPRTPSAPLRFVEPETADDVSWLPIKAVLVESLGADTVRTWFADARVVFIEGEQIVIAAGSETTKAKWEGQFISKIIEAVRLAYPKVTEVEFVVLPKTDTVPKGKAAAPSISTATPPASSAVYSEGIDSGMNARPKFTAPRTSLTSDEMRRRVAALAGTEARGASMGGNGIHGAGGQQ
jgi:hypothetical protein